MCDRNDYNDVETCYQGVGRGGGVLGQLGVGVGVGLRPNE